jgi:hypothetical protein
LFNKIIDDLLSTQNKKKEPVTSTVESQKPNSQNQRLEKPKEEKPLKLGSIDSKTWQNQVGGCCQKGS